MKTLSLGIVFTALGAGGVAAALGTVEQRIGSIGQKISELKGRQKSALESMDREWVWGGNSVKRYADEVDRLDRKITEQTNRKARLQMLGEQHNANKADLNSRWGDAMAAYGMTRVLEMPIKAYADQETAITSMRVAMMQADGTVSPFFDKLQKQVVDLGNELPGTTKDYAELATTMLNMGTAPDVLYGNALDSAAKLRALFQLSSETAGETVVKMREAYSLSDAELGRSADLIARAKEAGGMKPEDLVVGTSYNAATIHVLHLGGEKGMKDMLALQGMAKLQGMEPSSFGTNFSMMMTRLVSGPMMIEQAKRGMKASAREAMKKFDIKLDFFDEKGQFRGIKPMLGELEKLSNLSKVNEEAALTISQAVFGQEAARPALILGGYGVKGFENQLEKMDHHADLNAMMAEKNATTAMKWEVLKSNVENFWASFSGPAVNALKPAIASLGNFFGKLDSLAQAHPMVAKGLGLVIGLAVTATIGFLALGAALSFARYAFTGLQLIPFVGVGLSRAASGALRLGGILKGVLLSGLRLAGQAILFLGRALLMNPVGLVITAIAGVAYLIYRYWEPIKGFFSRLWGGVSSIFSRALHGITSLMSSAWNGIKSIFFGVMGAIVHFVAPVWQTIRNAFSEGITGVGKLILNWSPLGLFYKAFAGVLSWFGIDLPKNFTDFGGMLIDGLVQGFKAKLTAAKDAVLNFGRNIKGWFADTLGIASPSKVFMGFGGNISDGAAIGITKSLGAVKSASGKLAGAALAGAVATGGQALAGVEDAVQALPRVQAAAGAAGGMTIHFSPSITVGGAAGSEVKAQVQQAMQLSLRELEQMLRRIQAEQERRAF